MRTLPWPRAPSTPEAADRRWLGAVLLVGTLGYVGYLAFYPLPAKGAGFYLTVAEQVGQHGYALPRRVPYYTEGGVPYAYPPLMFYVVAVALDLGADPLALALVLPGVVTVVALVPFYALARAILGSPSRAGVASLLLAVTPAVLIWHVSAGGLVRAPAFLFTLSACYAGWRLFADGDRRWLAPAVVLSAATVLTHPVNAAFVGVSYLVLYAAVDRSARGLAFGTVVAAGSVLLSAPWWVPVVSWHGSDIFSAAARTHDGLGGGLPRVVESFLTPLLTINGDLPFYLLAFGGCVALLVRRRYLLPAWLLAAGYALRQERFLFVPGAMAAAVLLVDVVAPRARALLGGERGPLSRVPLARVARAGLAVLVVGTLVTAGWLALTPATGPGVVPPPDDERYAATSLPPMYVASDDVAAAEWVRANTPPDARFIVLGDAAEWFPYLTHRTLLLSPWGAEWEGPGAFQRHVGWYDSIADCDTAACATGALRTIPFDPDYLYLQTGHYTVRRVPYHRDARSIRSFAVSERYEVVFVNGGGFVVRVAE